MKLLFDHNLSPRLVNRLADLYPDSQHVFMIGLDQVDDSVIWGYSQQNDFVIVTKDSDFSDLSTIRGFPPKIIWIRRGNCSTNQIEQILRNSLSVTQKFYQDSFIGVLTLY
ncbi:MAG TPA: DUF5615 family PIN-like protein [Elainellaceae cyanobacterium]